MLAQLFALLTTWRGVCLVPSAAAGAMTRPRIAFVPVRDAEPTVVRLVGRDNAPRGLVGEFVRSDAAAKPGSKAPHQSLTLASSH